MGTVLTVLVKAGLVTALRLLLEWLGVPGWVVVTLAMTGLAVWSYRVLMRRRAARSAGKPVAERARRGAATGGGSWGGP